MTIRLPINSNRFSRRSAIKLLGGGAALLPLLSTTQPLADTAPPPPKRLIIVFSTNGMIRKEFWPTTTGANFEITPILEPLAAYKSRMIVVGGLEQKVVSDNSGSSHHNEAFLLTGVKATPGQLIDDHDNPDTPFPRGAGGPSVDQYIASQLPVCSTLPFKSLQLGALTLGMPLAWAGSNQPLPSNDDPYSVFDLLFGDLALGPEVLERIRKERRSVLDVVGGGLERFSRRLGTEDRIKIEGHRESIRELERQLDPNNAVNASCQVPTIGDRVDVKRPESYPTVIRAQTDLLVAALKCDATRIATLQFADNGAGHIVFPWLGSEFNASGDLGGFGDSNAHHMISHGAHSSDANRQKKVRCEQWYMEQIAYLADRLDEVPEGDGTMLDNTAILYINGMGEGASHYLHPLPAFVIGGCGGALKTGQYVRYGTTDPASNSDFGTNGYQPHNRLLATLCNAMGVPASYFGDQRYGGPLDELV